MQKIKNAILKLAEAIDALENATIYKNRILPIGSLFRTRKRMIEEMLAEDEETFNRPNELRITMEFNCSDGNKVVSRKVMSIEQVNSGFRKAEKELIETYIGLIAHPSVANTIFKNNR